MVVRNSINRSRGGIDALFFDGVYNSIPIIMYISVNNACLHLMKMSDNGN